MRFWTIAFFIIAAITGVFAFGGFAGASASMAQLLCIIFTALFLISAITDLVQSKNR